MTDVKNETRAVVKERQLDHPPRKGLVSADAKAPDRGVADGKRIQSRTGT